MTPNKNIKTLYTDLKPKIKQIVTKKKNDNNYGMKIPTISSFKYNQF